ncbi:DNA-directed RNA polymerase I subunit rpa2 [Mactra antiquata]
MWNEQSGFQGYDQGQGGGAGFMSPGGFGTPKEEKKSRQKLQSVVPVTVAEIINASQVDENFYAGDIQIHQVKIVGLVVAVKEDATRYDYEIDDLTGPPIEVRHYVDNDENLPSEERIPSMRENTYVRAFGTLRSFNGKKSINAYNVSAVTDMNELTYHMLEVIHSHASLTTQSNDTGGGMITNGTTQSYNDGGDGMVSGLTSIQNQVHQVIRNNPTSEGASIESVCKQVRGVPEKVIRDTIEFLSSEGHIYSTIDDDHYKATDS